MRNSVRPPTRIPQNLQESSVQCLLQFLHGEAFHSFRGWLGLENARLLGEWVEALLCRAGWLLLQLHVEHAAQLETSVFLDFCASNSHKSLNHCLCLLCLQTIGLCNGRKHPM